jgi:hypothetical protein
MTSVFGTTMQKSSCHHHPETSATGTKGPVIGASPGCLTVIVPDP